MSLIKIARQTIRRYNLLDKGDRVIIGVSGGPDSVALTLLLKSLSREMNLRLYVAHLDHQLRKGSYKESKFVESLARELSLPFFASKVNIPGLHSGGSVEEIARRQRLKFFFSLAAKIKADKIALGHNRDDQAETVLMRIIRGAGLSGLSSILPKRKIDDRVIIRPLIETPRQSIESYLNRIRVKALTDASNKEFIYFRNRIRHRLIPELSREYNSNIKQALANMAQLAACDYDYLEKAAQKELHKISRPLGGIKGKTAAGRRINLKRLQKLHTALQRLVLRLCIAGMKGSTRRLTFKHMQEIEDLISHRPVKSIVDLPQGIYVLKDKACLRIYKRHAGRCKKG